jgi:hypothetical protein
MNLQELQSLISYWTDDINQTYFMPTQTQRFLNNALKETNKKLIQLNDSWYMKCAQTVIPALQECIALPSDFLKVNHMDIILGGVPGNEQRYRLNHSTQTEADSVNYSAGQPCTFFLEKGALILRPVPDISYTLRMYYSYRIADMVNATDVPDVPYEYQEYLAVLATMDCYLKDQRDPTPFAAKKESYEKLMRESATDRLIDKPREIVVTMDDGGGALY